MRQQQASYFACFMEEESLLDLIYLPTAFITEWCLAWQCCFIRNFIEKELYFEEKEENDNYRVSYFIPKVCNVGLVNNLKGVKKLDIENIFI